MFFLFLAPNGALKDAPIEHPFFFFLEVVHAILHFVFILGNLFEVLVVFFYLPHIDVHDGMESHSAM